MSQPPIEIKRKPKLPWWWFLLLPVLVIGLVVAQAVGPNPPIELGRDTTYISEPLNSQGLPDYAQHLMTENSAGVTPENNAAVLILQAMGLESLDARHAQALVDALDMEWPTEVIESPYSDRVGEAVMSWATEVSPDLDEETKHKLKHDLITMAMQRSWQPDELPFLDAWVEDSAAPLDLLIEGAARPKYFVPPPNLESGEENLLFAMLLPDVSLLREAARALKLKAMYHVSHQEYAEAWESLLATYRLGRHCSQNPFLVHSLVAVAIEEMAHQSLPTLLSEPLPPSLLQQIRADLTSLPPSRPMSSVYSDGERLGGLDVISGLAQGRFQEISSYIDTTGTLTSVARVIRVDWNVALRETNRWYDRLSEATQLSYKDRIAALEEIEDDFPTWSPSEQPARMLHSIVSTRARSELVADILLQLMMPATLTATKAEDRLRIHNVLMDTAIALAHYRAEHGEYPTRLDDLVPTHLGEVPVDFYCDDRLIYKRQNAGYVLYSVFENGIDDSGTSFDGRIVRGQYASEEVEVPRGNGDLVVCVPVPPFKLPFEQTTESASDADEAAESRNSE